MSPEIAAILSQLTPLTIRQSTNRMWFLLRAFKFTSRTSSGYIQCFHRLSKSLNYELPIRQRELIFILYSHTDDTQTSNLLSREAALRTLKEHQSNLTVFKVLELNKFLSVLGFPLSGRKDAKINRLLEYLQRCNFQDDTDSSVSIDLTAEHFQRKVKAEYWKVAFNSWIMKPALRDNQNLRLGRMNEPVVLRNLPHFLKETYAVFDVTELFQTGLPMRLSLTESILAYSPDAIGLCKDIVENSSFVAALEVKTLTTFSSQRPAKTFISQYGPYDYITVGDNGQRSVYMEATLKLEYRAQCLHHASVLGVTNVLFVVASPTRILYVVRLTYPENIINYYRDYLLSVRDMALGWIGGNSLALPDDLVKTVCDNDDGTKFESFASFYEPCMSINRYCAEKSGPMPQADQVKPRIALAWNAVKGCADEFSRTLSLLKVDINGSHPNVKYVMREILSQTDNAFLAFRFLKCTEGHRKIQTESYRKERKQVTKSMSFKSYVRRAIDEILEFDPFAKIDDELCALPQRFTSKVLQSFSIKAMWDLRRQGTHAAIMQPFNLPKAGKKTRVKFGKWCAVSSSAVKVNINIEKKGRKTEYCRKQCMVPLCKPPLVSKKIVRMSAIPPLAVGSIFIEPVTSLRSQGQ